jgi:flagellar motility protein MotE (MotC chaperone)
MKKLLPTIGLYLGTFVVLNVAMFFLLKLTQPVPSPSELSMGHDSTGHDSTHVELTDSTAALEHSEEHGLTDNSALTDASHSAGEPAHAEQHTTEVAHEQAATKEPAPAETQIGEGAQTENAAMVDSTATGDEVAIEQPEATEGAGKSDLEIAKLAKILEGMKPAEAAVIAERLPTDTIVQLVMRMKARTGAKMMASLPVPVAASVAERMAELSGAKKS